MQTATLTLTQAAYAERYTLPVLRLYTTDGAEWQPRQRVITIGTAPDNDVVVTDGSVSRHHMEIVGERGGWRVRDLDSKNGTFVAGLRLGEALLGPHATLRLGQQELHVVVQAELMEITMAREPAFGTLHGADPSMREIFAWASMLATTEDPVWVDGEPGTGRMALAEALHRQSRRVRAPLVRVQLAAAGPHADAALWGDMRDHLGGPTLQAGAFTEATGGTLVLLEPAELPAADQKRLAKCLATKTWVDGAGQEQPLQTRVVLVQTGHSEHLIKTGQLQPALLEACARPLHLPPLRARKGDIPLLVLHFLETLQVRQPGLTPPVLSWQTLEQLQRYDWPGNVRELWTHLERAAQLADFAAPPRVLAGQEPAPVAVAADLATWSESRAAVLAAWERHYVEAVVAQVGDQPAAVARAMGLPRKSADWLLARYTSGNEHLPAGPADSRR
jgi:two-component system response regulator GlrR